jgi:hypothetical protein
MAVLVILLLLLPQDHARRLPEAPPAARLEDLVNVVASPGSVTGAIRRSGSRVNAASLIPTFVNLPCIQSNLDSDIPRSNNTNLDLKPQSINYLASSQAEYF